MNDTATEETVPVPVPVRTYIIEAERLAGELPARDADRLAFYKRRAPLGDAEFYLAVCDLAPALRDRLERLRAHMAHLFSLKGKIPKQLGAEVAAIMRQDRALRPPVYSGELSRRVPPVRDNKSLPPWPTAYEIPYLVRTTAVDPLASYLPCGEECRFSGEYGTTKCRVGKLWTEHAPRIPVDDTVVDPRD